MVERHLLTPGVYDERRGQRVLEQDVRVLDVANRADRLFHVSGDAGLYNAAAGELFFAQGLAQVGDDDEEDEENEETVEAADR